MKTKSATILLCLGLILSGPIFCQEPADAEIAFRFGELTAPEFILAVERSGGTCILPAGIMEKHGAHLPLSTDMIIAREIASRAAAMEYSVVFPEYYFGQIFEAKHQPGTIAYSKELIWMMLEETCEELSRNGLKKIIIVNGHGGNNHFFAYFCQAQLEKRKNYQVVLFQPDDSGISGQLEEMRTTDYGGHADEVETSMVHAIRPDLVKEERASQQSGRSLGRLDHLDHIYTGIWWYANFPNHYAGDGSSPLEKMGNLVLDHRAEQLAEVIRKLKKDETIRQLQEQFYRESENPLETGQ